MNTSGRVSPSTKKPKIEIAALEDEQKQLFSQRYRIKHKMINGDYFASAIILIVLDLLKSSSIIYLFNYLYIPLK